MSFIRVPMYFLVILGHHGSMIHTHFLWRTHCPTQGRCDLCFEVLLSLVMIKRFPSSFNSPPFFLAIMARSHSTLLRVIELRCGVSMRRQQWRQNCMNNSGQTMTHGDVVWSSDGARFNISNPWISTLRWPKILNGTPGLVRVRPEAECNIFSIC